VILHRRREVLKKMMQQLSLQYEAVKAQLHENETYTQVRVVYHLGNCIKLVAVIIIIMIIIAYDLFCALKFTQKHSKAHTCFPHLLLLTFNVTRTQSENVMRKGPLPHYHTEAVLDSFQLSNSSTQPR